MNTHYTLRGGSSTSGFYCGVFYVNVGATVSRPGWDYGAALLFGLSTHYTMRGGYSGNGFACGAFCVHLGDSASTAHWSRGAAL